MPVSGDTFQLRNYEDSDLKKHQCKTSKYTCSLIRPTRHLVADNATEGLPILRRLCAFLRLPSDAEVEAAKSQIPKSKSKPLEAEVDVEVEAARCRRRSSIPKLPRAFCRKLRGQGSKKKFRGQGSAKNREKALRGKPRKKAPRPRRLREKARGEGSAKTEGLRKTEGYAKAPQNLCGSSPKAPRKT